MIDPFPFPPNPALGEAVRPLAARLGLHSFPMHVHELLMATLFYTFVQLVVSPVLSRALMPHIYNASMSRLRRANWDAHVVSLVQSVLICILALWSIAVDDERRAMSGEPTTDPATALPLAAGWRGRVYGYSGGASLVQSMAAGYFLWDLALTLVYFDIFGFGMLAHAVSALAVYSLGFRPFLNYYAPNFILYELSTPFLNAHWFFDKLDMTGSRAQLYNGVALIVTFFGCRLVYGNYMSTWVYSDMWHAMWDGPGEFAIAGSSPDPIPAWLIVVYVASNLTLNSLNIVWFFKMIAAVRKRFVPSAHKDAADDKSAKTDDKSTTDDSTAAIASALDDASPVARLRAVGERLMMVEDDFTEIP
ncbi:duf887 domain containing protein [Grosmannia clavigera kw1407]|uniref:Duf887 domain containing protein n=1 Tax=Grosmannia clavigera (strain kw1407 / UAMH 11150) TaxID=655863 RepID=F0XMI8_GROCL|nr:duf887 domain containing protein [Grosmannia clavigera kw1407]EFX01433.1 duf887 domain containing protein [Grosmannia clavigera kw1407]